MSAKSVSMTLKQLSTLRLALRLQKVKAIKLQLLKFRAGTALEHEATAAILESHDDINSLDFGLLLLESRTFSESGGNPLAAVRLLMGPKHLELALRAAQSHYGAEGAYGSQAEQALLLQAIADERDGIMAALNSATEVGDEQQVLVMQRQPRGQQ